jgi:hypothetical protein
VPVEPAGETVQVPVPAQATGASQAVSAAPQATTPPVNGEAQAAAATNGHAIHVNVDAAGAPESVPVRAPAGSLQ